MTIPVNPKLTKLRILAKRQKNIWLKIREAEIEAGDKKDAMWVDYVKACKDFGYCAFCEEPLTNCDCIAQVR